MPAQLLDHRFLFVVGKGGVGKTTVATAMALAAARKGKRVLLAMCNAKERVSQLLEVSPIGADIVHVAPRFDAVNMRPDAALEEYGILVLKVRALYSMIFENRFIAAFLRGVPGMDAWAMLGKAYFHATHEEDGRPQYDLVIVDAPATGHGLEMLRVPRVITAVAPPGLLRREAEKAWDLFTDPVRTGVVIVTLPEEMPVAETIELHKALTVELGMPVKRLVANSVLPPIFTGVERQAMAALREQLEAGSQLGSLALAGRARALREEVQAQSLARLKQAIPDVARTELPHLFVTEFKRAAVESLSGAF